MPILEKFKRIIKSNINDILDRTEDPETVLNQILEDMQHELKDTKIHVAAAIRDQHRLEIQYKENQTEAGKWEQRAVQFIESGDDTRAREALKRKRSFSELATSFKQQLDAQRESVLMLKDGLTTLQSRIDEAQRKKALLIARQKRAQAERSIRETMAGIANSSAAGAFERIHTRVSDAEAEAEAAREVEMLSIDHQFRELETDELEDELSRLKQRVRPKQADEGKE